MHNENKKAEFATCKFLVLQILVTAFMKCVDMLLTITVSLQCRKKIRKKINAEFATCMKTEK